MPKRDILEVRKQFKVFSSSDLVTHQYLISYSIYKLIAVANLTF